MKFTVFVFSLLVISGILVMFSSQNQALAQEEKIFPDWVRYSTSAWINDDISDSEFLALIENVLNQNILPQELETVTELKNTARTVVSDIPELNQKEGHELIPVWVKDRAEWWIDDKITDAQFLRTVHYLREFGYLEYNPEKSIFSNEETFQSSLERFLLDEKEILDITKQTKWRILSTEYEFEEREGIVDSVKIIFTDITRVYEPVFYKFKVPSMTMQISEFNNKKDLEKYWDIFEGKNKQMIFESAYLTGNPNDNSECFFEYTTDGAITFCIYDSLIIQVIIFDQHNEHYNYNVNNLAIDKTEPTITFTNEILKKISSYKNHKLNNNLYQTLQKNNIENIQENSEHNVKTVPTNTELEKSVTQGIEKYSCIRDDFGLVTISGQYNNDNTKRAQVNLDILFLDNKGNTVGKTSTEFYDLKEYESKRFVGHTKWDKNFHTCQMRVQ